MLANPSEIGRTTCEHDRRTISVDIKSFVMSSSVDLFADVNVTLHEGVPWSPLAS